MTLTIKYLIDPFTILCFLVLIGLGCLFFRKERFAKALFIGAGAWFLIISTPLVPILLLNSLERQYEPIMVEQIPDMHAEYHILVLGGGHGFDDRLPANSLLSLNALSRLNEGIRLQSQLPNSRLILSGYSSSGRTSQAEMLRDAALLLGVEISRTMMQSEPGTTLEEARVYSERYAGNQQVILVTSAVHMPRSVMLFERAGVDVIPSPANYKLKGSWRYVRLGWPSMDNIGKLRVAIHEYAAILKYKIV